MGKKKRKQKEGDLSYIIWCYYCDRQFADEATLIQHQKAKHFKCESCGKKLSGISGLTIHASQVHKINMSLVPNAKPGRDSVTKEVFGMAGVPPGMKPGGEIDEHVAKKAKLEAQHQLVPGMSVPLQPPFAPPAPFPTVPPLQPQSFPQNPPPFPAYGGVHPPSMAPPTAMYPPPFPQPPNAYGAPPLPGFGMPPMIPGQPIPQPIGGPPIGPGLPPPSSITPPTIPPPIPGHLNNNNIVNGQNQQLGVGFQQPQPLFPVSQTTSHAVVEKTTRGNEQQVVVQDKVQWQEEDISPEEKRAMGTLYKNFLQTNRVPNIA